MIENFKKFNLNFGDQKFVIKFFGNNQVFWGNDHKLFIIGSMVKIKPSSIR